MKLRNYLPPNPSDWTLGTHLRAARLKAKMPTKVLAKKLNMPDGTLSMYELGHRVLPEGTFKRAMNIIRDHEHSN
jgi:DNA-binding transcriptional regulator YiaG